MYEQGLYHVNPYMLGYLAGKWETGHGGLVLR